MARFLAINNRKNLSVEVHPLALPAFDFYRTQAHRFTCSMLSPNAIKLLQSSTIFLAELDSNRLKIISGFETIGFTPSQLDLSGLSVVIDNKMSNEKIEIIAWLSSIRTILSSLDSHQLEPLRKDLNASLPSFLSQSLFNTEQLTQKHLSNISGISVSGLKKQRRPIERNIPSIESFGIYADIQAGLSTNGKNE